MRLKQLLERLSQEQQEKIPCSPQEIETYLATWIPGRLLKNETLQKSFGISTQEMEELYAEGHAYYTADELSAALTHFRWLTLFNPYVTKYWMGVGASWQGLEKYELALHAYAVCTLLDRKNPFPHFHAAECYAALGQKEQTLKALEDAYKRSVGKEAYRVLRHTIETHFLG